MTYSFQLSRKRQLLEEKNKHSDRQPVHLRFRSTWDFKEIDFGTSSGLQQICQRKNRKIREF